MRSRCLGAGFDQLIRPTDPTAPGRVCPAWSEVPSGHDYLAMSVARLQTVFDNWGDRSQTPWHVIDSIYWHTPDKSFEPCDCTVGARNPCDRVQILLPQAFWYVFQRSL